MSQWIPAGVFKSRAVAGQPAQNLSLAARDIATPQDKQLSELPPELQALVFTIPAVTFTFEIDLVGHYRVTVNFKGMDIDVG